MNEFLENKNNKKNYSAYRSNIKNKLPWVDKYRPKKLSEVINQDEVVNVLKETTKTGNLPHLLLYGPPGSGKTSTGLAMAYELFGPKIFHERVIELNASDERGIGIVRNKITNFAKTAIGNSDPNYPSPPYKIIILDEADAMTNEAQSALRKVMEQLSNITRFFFICNFIGRIIDPIASRCMKFRFKPINIESMGNKLEAIAKSENIPVTEEITNKISEIVKGDARKGIMTLQNLKYKYNYKKSITLQDVYEITNYLPLEYIEPMWKICMDTTSSTIKDIVNETNKLKAEGYPLHAILEQIKQLVITSDALDDNKKSLICMQLAITEKRLTDGANEYIQLLNVFTYIMGIKRDQISFIPSCIC
jgi:replication factor C subunit 2/4